MLSRPFKVILNRLLRLFDATLMDQKRSPGRPLRPETLPTLGFSGDDVQLVGYQCWFRDIFTRCIVLRVLHACRGIRSFLWARHVARHGRDVSSGDSRQGVRSWAGRRHFGANIMRFCGVACQIALYNKKTSATFPVTVILYALRISHLPQCASIGTSCTPSCILTQGGLFRTIF